MRPLLRPSNARLSRALASAFHGLSMFPAHYRCTDDRIPRAGGVANRVRKVTHAGCPHNPPFWGDARERSLGQSGRARDLQAFQDVVAG